MSNEYSELSLLAVRPTPRQTQIAAGVALSLVAGLAASAPFADIPLLRVDSFIPAVESVVILTDFITSVLLFSQSRISRSRALLALASGYLFTSLIIVSHILTFPGAVSPGGLFGAGLQTAGWLYVFWHLGLAASIVAYAHLKNGEVDDDPTTKAQSAYPIAWRVTVVVGVALGLTVLVTAGEQILPVLFVDRMTLAPLARYVLAFNGLVCVAAFAVLWIQRRRSVLDQWLMVVTLALISEVVSNVFLISARFTFGWYTSRLFAIVTSAIVLAVLIQETVMLYGRMARANAMLLRERKNKLLNLEALAGAIRHEVGQPLAAAGLNAQAVELFLNQTPPELDGARSAAEDIAKATQRIGEVLDDMRGLFGQPRHESIPVDVNDLVLEVLHNLDMELKGHKVVVDVELTADLPPVIGQRGQLQEVMVNLVQNAIDAMQSVNEKRRKLQLRTERCGADSIRVTVADTGPGIDLGKSDEIFEAFFTTKTNGMGLGLAICRMIVERHGGQLSASSASPHGAIFQITLPQSARVPDVASEPLQPTLGQLSGMASILPASWSPCRGDATAPMIWPAS